jgi:signal transduction histidine kinase
VTKLTPPGATQTLPYTDRMNHPWRQMQAWRWTGPSIPLTVAAYLAWAAVALAPLADAVSGRLSLTGWSVAGLVSLIAVPVLFTFANFSRPEQARTRTRHALMLLQACAAVLACWGLKYIPLAALLVIVAAQFGGVYRPRTTFLLLLVANLAFLASLVSWLDVESILTVMIGYGSLEAFAAAAMSYAKQAVAARDIAMLTTSELLATRQLLLESARGEERLRLSRELHDVVGHKLTALKMQLRLGMRDAASPTRESLSECMRLSDELLTDVRGVVSTLRAADGIDLHQSLAALVPAIPRPHVRLELADDARVPRVEQAETFLRCAQEGLTNALRHSGAENITLRLTRSDTGIALSIEDDGHAQASPRWGNGLKGMQERLNQLGGTLEVAAAEGRGLKVRAWLPQLDPQAANS